MRDGRQDESCVRHGREVDERCALVVRRGEREPCLAGAAGPGQRHEACVLPAEEPADGRDLEVAADQPRRRSRHGLRRHLCTGCLRSGEILVLAKDPLLECPELRAGLEAELVERGARVAVGGEGVRLAPGAVEGEHEQGAEGLAVGMRRNKGFELCGDGGVVGAGEVMVDAGLEGDEPRFVEPRGVGAGEGLVGQICEGRPPPEGERDRKVVATALDELAEAVCVELPGVDVEQVAGRSRLDAVGAERRTERVDVDLHGVVGASGR